MQDVKTTTSKWMKTQSPQHADFGWQRGYAAFSVGPSDLNSLIAYIDNQEQHHRTRNFQDEMRMFLHKYGVQFDEAYVWN